MRRAVYAPPGGGDDRLTVIRALAEHYQTADLHAIGELTLDQQEFLCKEFETVRSEQRWSLMKESDRAIARQLGFGGGA